MSAADKLAQVIAEHADWSYRDIWEESDDPDKRGTFCDGCNMKLADLNPDGTWEEAKRLIAAHQATVLAAEGWAQGAEEFGVRYEGGDVYENSCEDAARESIKYARDEHSLIGTLVRRRVTDWEAVEGEQK